MYFAADEDQGFSETMKIVGKRSQETCGCTSVDTEQCIYYSYA